MPQKKCVSQKKQKKSKQTKYSKFGKLVVRWRERDNTGWPICAKVG